MLTLKLKDTELYNPITNEFIDIKGGTFRFEHSLKSVAKWEEMYQKPFIVRTEHTQQEMMDYYMCMSLDGGLNKALLTTENIVKLNEYIGSERTATRITQKSSSQNPGGTYVSSEVIYAQMAMAGVPFEADRWHLSRLMALLGVISVKSGTGDANKMSRAEIYEENRRLNEMRRKQFNTKG